MAVLDIRHQLAITVGHASNDSEDSQNRVSSECESPNLERGSSSDSPGALCRAHYLSPPSSSVSLLPTYNLSHP